MPDRRGSRFALEVLFLLGLTVALTLAKLKPLEIAGVMLLGWVIVAAVEWAAWRDEPHYGSGLPPRYYVPRVNLPPAQPLEQVAIGYPEAQRDEAPTWIASAALREEMLGEWPVASPAIDPEQPNEQRVDGWLVEELPAEPLSALAPERQPGAEQQIDVVLARSVQGTARYSLDPLGDPPPRRRFGRGAGSDAPAVDVPARPEGVRALPGRTRQD